MATVREPRRNFSVLLKPLSLAKGLISFTVLACVCVSCSLPPASMSASLLPTGTSDAQGSLWCCKSPSQPVFFRLLPDAEASSLPRGNALHAICAKKAIKNGGFQQRSSLSSRRPLTTANGPFLTPVFGGPTRCALRSYTLLGKSFACVHRCTVRRNAPRKNLFGTHHLASGNT